MAADRAVAARREGLSWQQVDDEIVVLDLQTSCYLSLNGSAAVLWISLTEGQHTAASLAQVLTQRFEVDSVQADADAAAFLTRCASLGLVE